MLMHIVTCSNCLDSNRTVALRTGVDQKKIFFVNFQTNSRVICPLCLYKIFHCWINPENFSHVFELIMKTKHKWFLTHRFNLYRSMGVIIDREERYALNSAEVYADQ